MSTTEITKDPSDGMVATLRALRDRDSTIVATYIEGSDRMVVERPRTAFRPCVRMVIDADGYVDPDRVYSFRSRYFEDGQDL